MMRRYSVESVPRMRLSRVPAEGQHQHPGHHQHDGERDVVDPEVGGSAVLTNTWLKPNQSVWRARGREHHDDGVGEGHGALEALHPVGGVRPHPLHRPALGSGELPRVAAVGGVRHGGDSTHPTGDTERDAGGVIGLAGDAATDEG